MTRWLDRNGKAAPGVIRADDQCRRSAPLAGSDDERVGTVDDVSDVLRR